MASDPDLYPAPPSIADVSAALWRSSRARRPPPGPREPGGHVRIWRGYHLSVSFLRGLGSLFVAAVAVDLARMIALSERRRGEVVFLGLAASRLWGVPLMGFLTTIDVRNTTGRRASTVAFPRVRVAGVVDAPGATVRNRTAAVPAGWVRDRDGLHVLDRLPCILWLSSHHDPTCGSGACGAAVAAMGLLHEAVAFDITSSDALARSRDREAAAVQWLATARGAEPGFGDGASALPFLRRLDAGPASVPERQLLWLFLCAGIIVVTQLELLVDGARYVVDFAIPALRLVFEYDGTEKYLAHLRTLKRSLAARIDADPSFARRLEDDLLAHVHGEQERRTADLFTIDWQVIRFNKVDMKEQDALIARAAECVAAREQQLAGRDRT